MGRGKPIDEVACRWWWLGSSLLGSRGKQGKARRVRDRAAFGALISSEHDPLAAIKTGKAGQRAGSEREGH